MKKISFSERLMKRVKTILSFLGIIFIGLVSPLWVGGTYMFITGHAKGYAYDMGSEAGVSIFIGSVMLIIWPAVFVPLMVGLSRKCFKTKKVLVFLPILTFIVCFVFGVFLLGTDEFLKQFGI